MAVVPNLVPSGFPLSSLLVFLPIYLRSGLQLLSAILSYFPVTRPLFRSSHIFPPFPSLNKFASYFFLPSFRITALSLSARLSLFHLLASAASSSVCRSLPMIVYDNHVTPTYEILKSDVRHHSKLILQCVHKHLYELCDIIIHLESGGSLIKSG
jgi:hypothetical protein